MFSAWFLGTKSLSNCLDMAVRLSQLSQLQFYDTPPNLARSLTYLNPKIGLLFGTSMFRLWISKVFSYHPADDAFEGVK